MSVESVRQLMEADRWIDRVVHQRAQLPERGELAAIEDQLRDLVARVKELTERLEPLRRELTSTANEASRLEQRAKDLDAALATPSAARDLAAVDKEIRHVRDVLRGAEDKELALMEEVEPLEKAIGEIRSAAQPLAERRVELRASIVALEASLDEEIAALRRDRAAVTHQVNPALLGRYEAAMKRVGVSGAAQLDHGRCDGCRIALAPLDIDRLGQLGSDELGDCPECGRLLVVS